MPYRVDVPEGQEALVHILNHLGTDQLIEARQRMFRTIYDAPETTLTAREREGMRYWLRRNRRPGDHARHLGRHWTGA